MLKRINALLRFLEAGVMGWFLIQSARWLVMWAFARASGSEVAIRLYGPEAELASTARIEFGAVAVAALVPFLALILQRWKINVPMMVALAALGHVMMVTDNPTVQIISAAGVLGATGIYFALIARHWADYFPLGLVVGLTVDQVIRAFGDTRDFSLDTTYLTLQTIVSVSIVVATLLVWLTRGVSEAVNAEGKAPADTDAALPEALRPAATRKGKISFWGGVALGALLFLELALLALPNAAARVSRSSYVPLLPWLIGATALPALPVVRGRMRRFIEMFDGALRGWLWFLLIGLGLIMGMRLGTVVGAVGMVTSQFFVVLTLWWVVEPAREGEHGYTGLSIVIAWGVFGLLAVGNLFTFVYGASTIPTVTAFKGAGWIIFMAAALLACLPVIIARVRIPWRGGSVLASLGLLVLGAGAVGAGVWPYWTPLMAQSVQSSVQLRVATYNIHSGYDTLYRPSLDEIADLISATSVDIVLLQEVDAGRLSSNGVDQAWWLARHLRMQLAYYPGNESVYGLAVLSRVRLIDEDGSPLTSARGEQTSVQRVRVCTESGSGPCPNDKIIDIYNTWLGRPERDIAPQDLDQWTQASEILRWVQQNIRDATEPWVVVGGTFNATPDSLLYDQMEVYGYVDPFAALMRPPEQSATYCPGACLARFDYLWLHHLTPQIAAVIDSEVSDHRMAVVEVNLEREEAGAE